MKLKNTKFLSRNRCFFSLQKAHVLLLCMMYIHTKIHRNLFIPFGIKWNKEIIYREPFTWIVKLILYLIYLSFSKIRPPLETSKKNKEIIPNQPWTGISVNPGLHLSKYIPNFIQIFPSDGLVKAYQIYTFFTLITSNVMWLMWCYQYFLIKKPDNNKKNKMLNGPAPYRSQISQPLYRRHWLPPAPCSM